MTIKLSQRFWMLAAASDRKVSCGGTLAFKVKGKNKYLVVVVLRVVKD